MHWFVIGKLFPGKGRLTASHVFLLVVSYFFYMSWDWRFGFLMAFSTTLDYSIGIWMENADKNQRSKHFALIFSIITNIGFLSYFKYTDFFIESFIELVNAIAPGSYSGSDRERMLLHIILPLGISFFTFQSMSYTIDVYRKIIPAERNFIRFALFVSFFPQLVAGPIVVARDFLPQLQKLPVFQIQEMRIAARWFFLGLIKKTVIADNMAGIVDPVFASPSMFDPFEHWVAAFAFWAQVYCDFSGYSDMAWGSAIALGYKLPENFRMPYLSFTVAEHWQRWHISLIKWIRDYLYIPLGGNRVSSVRHKFNIFLTMFAAGLWHGANWTYVIWGSIHGLILIIESTVESFIKKHNLRIHSMMLRIPVLFVLFLYTTFITVGFGTMFRAKNISEALIILKRLLFIDVPFFHQLQPAFYRPVFFAVIAIYLSHFFGKLIFEKKLQPKINVYIELAIIPVLIVLLTQLAAMNTAPFIYFVF